jgi:hypothetical protein
VPQINHVWIVVMENTAYSSITQSAAPYMAGTIAGMGVQMNSYYAVTHPSLPNYLCMVGGDNFGISSDGAASSSSYQVSSSNQDIASQLEGAGFTWHEYSESQPSPCGIDDSGSDSTGDFASKHDPMPHFLITQNNSSSCQANDVSYDPQGSMPGMVSDVQSGTFFNYVFIAPNLCDDGHDSCAPISNKVGQQDAWAQANLPYILNSSAFADHGVLFLTWDEGSGSGNSPSQIATYILSPMLASPGGTNNSMYSHFSMLATIEAGFGLSNLPQANGHSDALITDIWK